MARHHDPLLSFDVPRDWVDRSEVRYEMPARTADEKSPGRAVLARDRLRADEDLRAYVERRLAEIAAAGEGFVLRAVEPGAADQRPAVNMRYATVEDGVPCEHRALAVQLAEDVVATLTLSAARTELAQLEPLFDRMLSSVSVGRESDF
jgi:hypothetical protein